MKMSDKQSRCILQTNTPYCLFVSDLRQFSIYTSFYIPLEFSTRQTIAFAASISVRSMLHVLCVILFCKHPYSSIFCNGIHFIIDWHGNIYKNTLRMELLHRISIVNKKYELLTMYFRIYDYSLDDFLIP